MVAMFARIATTYGWTDETILQLVHRKTMIYGRLVDLVDADRLAPWLAILPTAVNAPKRMGELGTQVKTMRLQALGRLQPKPAIVPPEGQLAPVDTSDPLQKQLAAWSLDPLLGAHISVVKKVPSQAQKDDPPSSADTVDEP